MYDAKLNPSCLMLLIHDIIRAFSRALFSAGSNIPAKMAMIEITIKSSINVKIFLPFRN